MAPLDITFGTMTWRKSMKVGDLVRDKDYNRKNELGVIVEVDEPLEMYKVIWNGRGKEWSTEMYLEVVNESR